MTPEPARDPQSAIRNSRLHPLKIGASLPK